MKKELTEDIKRLIAEDPYYFVYQGGSDGTFAHEEFLDEYGQYMPDISRYAASLLSKRGETW